jgi:hypothetical protein
MTDEMSCPACGQQTCWTVTGYRCCDACSGNHANDTYDRYYPPASNSTNQETR